MTLISLLSIKKSSGNGRNSRTISLSIVRPHQGKSLCPASAAAVPPQRFSRKQYFEVPCCTLIGSSPGFHPLMSRILRKIWVSYLFSRATEKTLLMKNTNCSGVPRIITKRYALAHVRRQGRVQGNAVPKSECRHGALFMPWQLSAAVDQAVQAIQAFEEEMRLFPNAAPVPFSFRCARAALRHLALALARKVRCLR
jgi:hypothetical protein